ncbi:G-protein coupled receptor 158 smog [Arctopsyche grandis]|uniref:G-protein coupled receptor 158 smog n=1 Tax=Arctopsyche grandis TaxID=121162 RepID=UPI00406D71B3
MWRVWLLLVTLLGAAGAQEGKVGPQKKPSPQNAPSGAPPGAKNPCESPVLDVTPKPPPTAVLDRESASNLARSMSRLLAHQQERSAQDRAGALAPSAAALAKKVIDENNGIHAVGVGLPQINLGLLHFRHHVVIFQNNNTAYLEHYWKALALSWNHTSGVWVPPFLECNPHSTEIWLHGFAIALTVEKQRAVAGIFRPLRLDQCDSMMAKLFGGPHRCDEETTKCVSEEGRGFRRAGYRCECRDGFYNPGAPPSWRGFPGEIVELDPNDVHRCTACPEQCNTCNSAGKCGVQRDPLVRGALLATQAACMLITVMMAAIVFKQRKCKTIASGMWTILETILLGTFLLYSTVVVRFFEPSVEQCLVEPWFRELGFVVCYGAIILKLYRHLIEFRTRKAHRWVVKDVDLLKYLLAMVVAVLCYLAAFTASSLNFIREQYKLVRTEETSSGQLFLACKPLWWDYVTEAGEMLILVFGIHLSYASRNAFTQFQERRFLCAAICVEAIVSGVFYVLRAFYVTTLHPDYMYLAYFVRSQLTSTVVILLIFTPKLWYQHKQVRSLAQEFSCRLPVDAFRAGEAGALTADGDVAELNLADMNPEDIRAELKRLYTQLEVLRNKTLRADNPHISKRRGGRKVAHRRFSLQKKGSREKVRRLVSLP